MRRQSAFTLIELIVTLIVIGIGAAALLNVFGTLLRGSADPVIQQQATTVAEAYMEEILLRAFAEPDPLVAESGGAEAGETRPTYDDVQDYNGLAASGITEVQDQNGTPIPALTDYSVFVTVGAAMINTVPAMQVEVRVTHPVISDITLTAYRTQYQ